MQEITFSPYETNKKIVNKSKTKVNNCLNAKIVSCLSRVQAAADVV